MMTPEWVSEYAQDCRLLLGIGDEWHISIHMTDKPDGTETAGGAVEIDAEYLNADIELRRDSFGASPNADGRQIILHEMMHIALANYRMVLDQIFMKLPDDMQTMARIMVSQAEEQFVQRTTRALLRIIKPSEGG